MHLKRSVTSPISMLTNLALKHYIPNGFTTKRVF